MSDTPTPTDADVRRLMELEEKSSKEWYELADGEVCGEDNRGAFVVCELPGAYPERRANIDLIISLRNLCRPLCEEVLRLREENKQLRTCGDMTIRGMGELRSMLSDREKEWQRAADDTANALRAELDAANAKIAEQAEKIESLESEARCCDHDYAKNLASIRAERDAATKRVEAAERELASIRVLSSHTN